MDSLIESIIASDIAISRLRPAYDARPTLSMAELLLQSAESRIASEAEAIPFLAIIGYRERKIREAQERELSILSSASERSENDADFMAALADYRGKGGLC